MLRIIIIVSVLMMSLPAVGSQDTSLYLRIKNIFKQSQSKQKSAPANSVYYGAACSPVTKLNNCDTIKK